MKYLYLILPFLLLTSCSKEEEGCLDCLETFRCKINGEMWAPNCESGTILWGCTAIRCRYNENSRALEMRVVNEGHNSRLLINGRSIVLGNNPMFYTDREYIDYSRGNCGSYDLIQELPNYINVINIDTSEHTIEGTFAFSVLGECDQDTLHITDGYFHLYH